mgnify:CR=1 FL=1
MIIDDRDPEPPEPPTLDELEAAHRVWLKTPDGVGDGPQAASFVLDSLPFLFAELRRWRGLEATQEYRSYAPCTDGCDHPGAVMPSPTPEQALRMAEHLGGQAQVRTVYATEWAEINEPPF